METQKRKLLVVEDDEDSQKFLALYLKRSFDLEMCNSADTFYEKLENYEFDLDSFMKEKIKHLDYLKVRKKKK